MQTPPQVQREAPRFSAKHGSSLLDDISSPESAAEASFHEKYRMVGKLGRGGFGTVLKIRDRITDEPLAMKKAHRGSLRGEWEILSELREANASTRILFPRSFLDLGDGEHAILFPLLARSLEGEKLSRKEAGDVCNQISVALYDLLAFGYHHLDVHPGNFLMAYDGNVFLSDFGNALHAKDFGVDDVPEAAQAFVATEVLSNAVEASQLHKADMFGLGMSLPAVCSGERFRIEHRREMQASPELFLRRYGAWVGDPARDLQALSALSPDPATRPSAPTNF